MAASILAPVLFVFLILGGLGIFSKIYRQRQASRLYNPWFPSHPERDIYVTLLGQEPSPSDALLKAALLRRAVADVKRIVRLRDDKTALTALLQKGSISEDLWANFQAAEKEMETEMAEVFSEANTFVEGWGPIIFQSASEIIQNEKIRDILSEVPKRRAELAAQYSLPGPTPSTNAPAPSASTSALLSPTRLTQRTSSVVSPTPPLTPSTSHIELPDESPSASKTTPSKSKKNKKRK